MIPRAHRVLVTRAAFLLVSISARAHGEASLDDTHAAGFYLARAGAVAAATGLSWATYALIPPHAPAPVADEWLGIDAIVRGHLSSSASLASDVTGLVTLAVPLAMQLDGGVTTRFANSSVVYAEVLSASLLLNTVVKHAMPRLRPYTYGTPRRTSFIESQVGDAYLSFYSGHASTAFAAAASGSFMFGASHPDDVATRWIFGTEAFLAATTAGLRVRAGKHYFSDVAVGAILGAAIGTVLPLAEGVHYRPSAIDLAFTSGGVLTGIAAAALVPFHDDPEPTTTTRSRIRFAPLFGRGSVGISALGDF